MIRLTVQNLSTKVTDPQAVTGPFNHLNTLTKPFTMSSGGYMIKMICGNVSYVYGEMVPAWVKEMKHPDSRLAKRNLHVSATY